MQSSDENELWCPSQSLWILIADHVPGSELSEIYRALGSSLVDGYKAAHTEAEKLFKTWQDSQQGNIGSRAGTPIPRLQGSPLADPPAIKELLRAEVKMLLQTLQDRVGRGGRDEEMLFSRYKPEMVDYALGHLDSYQRNSIDPADSGYGSRPSSTCSVRSIAKDEIESMRDKLNITGIDQVVERLRSILTEEYAELKRLVKHFKENFKQKCWCQLGKSEPSLAELKELRRAIQMDLELHPSSLAASPSRFSPLPLESLKHRLSAHQVSNETLQGLSTTPALKPHPLSSLSQTKPKPPLSAPPNKTPTPVKLIKSPSPFRTQGQHRSTPASPGPENIQTSICSRITTSGHTLSQGTTSSPEPGRDQIEDKPRWDCGVPQEQQKTIASSPSFQEGTTRHSPIPIIQSSNWSHSPRLQHGLSPQTERRRSPSLRLGHKNTPHPPPLCDTDSYSSDATDRSLSTTGNLKTQNGGQKNTCGGSVKLETVQTGKSDPERFIKGYSVLSGSRNSPSRTETKERNDRMNVNRNRDLKKDVTEPRFEQLNKRDFSSLKRPSKGTSQRQEAKTELEFIGQLKQPVPPPRVTA
ncbi:coiled-coil domain-containing protein 24 [Cheilinus undulatus]|uniref:coiled-coil domain-containing protein 24 n=1 Tax=Cheilinus undulatus TaxID=241271 RepID=UPI001BD25BC0|nr:coiled-coil domain-containing protein 24 [Cheilinus undulatus]